MKLKRHRQLNLVGGSSAAILCVLALVLLNPNAMNSTTALQCGAETCGANSTESKARTGLNAEIASVIAVGVTPSVNLEITPRSTGVFQTSTAKLNIQTNNNSGFSVYMRTANGKSTLSSTDKTNTQAINAVAENGEFTANTWGYKLGTDTQYHPVATSADRPILNETNVNLGQGNEYDLTFGVNVDTSLPAGQYSNAVEISALANPTAVTSLYQLTYMQDMTPKICEQTADYVDVNNYVTKQLIDTRDGKKYWVAKLADGNCWMTQNLALDLSTERTLTATDTDLVYAPQENGKAYEFTPLSNTSDVIEKVSGGLDEPAVTQSWDFGDYVTVAGGVDINGTLSGHSADTLAGNEEDGILDVSGREWAPTYYAQPGSWEYDPLQGIITSTNLNAYTHQNTMVAANSSQKTYDAHYLIGNYYQFNTATAGLGLDAAENTYVNASICPKGWMLPRAGTIQNPGEKSFENLLASQFGGPLTEDSNHFIHVQTTVAPLYFTRSGANLRFDKAASNSAIVNLGWNGGYFTGVKFHQDPNGSFWQTTAKSILLDYDVVLSTNHTTGIWQATPIRCVAR